MSTRYRLAWPRGVFSFIGAAGLAALPLFHAEGQDRAAANESASIIQAVPADPSEQGDGTMSPAARAAIERGPLPASADAVAAKAAANAASGAAEQAGNEADLAPAGGTPQSPSVPVILREFAGEFDPTATPSDSTGAIGTTRYVQLVNTRFAIYNRTSTTPLASGPLNTLAGVATPFTPDPQIIWDATTSRFYYVMIGVFSATDNRLLFGFSKTPSPSSAADWCKYTIDYGAELPDFPKLGDTQHFAVIGVNAFAPKGPGFFFRGSDVLALDKPPTGTACPPSVTVGIRPNLVDSGGDPVFTPVPGNQIDTAVDGYVVASNALVPSSRLWIFRVTRGTDELPVIGIGKALAVPSYAIPPDATQSGLTQKLDTLFAQNTQAVLARNPRSSNAFSLWTQHTVANSGVSAIRWYEINPVGTPSLRRTGLIAAPGAFLYNAAISPDRRVDGATTAFGGSFVIGYSASSAANGINPRIVMASSVNSGALSFTLVEDAVGPYRDVSCPNPGDTCRWGDYSAATPDPRPGTTNQGKVWLTNQFAGSTDTLISQSNWRTRIWAARP
jgi:hypothetical protein